MANQRLFALWGCGHFPYYLGGEVDRILEDGRVKVKEYGGGVFRPQKILPLEQGQKILAQLDALEAKYKKELKRLNETYNQKVREIVNV